MADLFDAASEASGGSILVEAGEIDRSQFAIGLVIAQFIVSGRKGWRPLRPGCLFWTAARLAVLGTRRGDGGASRGCGPGPLH